MVDTELADALKACGAIKFGDFVLSSGKKSKYYVDIKKASTEPKILKLIAERMANRLKELEKKKGKKIERIAGVELGAVPIAVAVSLELSIPLIIIRKAEKTHGIKERIVGKINPGDGVVLLEDVVTTGKSVLGGAEAIRAAKGEIDEVIAIVDREEGSLNALEEKGLKLTALVKASELLEHSK